MLTFRRRLSQLILTVSICVLVFTSCNSSRHIACTYFQDNRSYSIIIRKPYKTKTFKKRHLSTLKFNYKKPLYANQNVNKAINSEINKHKTDFTYNNSEIIEQMSQRNEGTRYVHEYKTIAPPEVVTYSTSKKGLRNSKKVFKNLYNNPSNDKPK